MQLREPLIVLISGFTLFTKSLPLSSAQLAQPQLDRRRVTYSVVPVDGGSQTPTLDVTMVVTVPALIPHVTQTTVTTLTLDEPTSTSTVSATSTAIWWPPSTNITSQPLPYLAVSTSTTTAPSIASLGTTLIVTESSGGYTPTTSTLGQIFSRPTFSSSKSSVAGSNLTFHIINTVSALAQSSTLRLPPLPTQGYMNRS